MNNDVLVFRRSMDEGEIGLLRFMSADHIERCRIHLYVTFRLDLWFNCVHWLLLITGLLVSLHYCVFVFGFSGLGQGSTDYINISTDNKKVNEMSINTTTDYKELTDMLFKAFAQAGFARKGQDENDHYFHVPRERLSIHLPVTLVNLCAWNVLQVVIS